MYVVTVHFNCHAEHAEHFTTRVLQQATDSLNREPGCIQFDVCRNPKDSRHVFLYEIYTDEPAFQQHLLSDHFLAFDNACRGWLVSKHVEIFDKL